MTRRASSELERDRPRESLLSDPPDAPSSVARTIGIGCAVSAVVALLLLGALGLVVGAWSRFAQPAIEEATTGGGEDDATGTGILTGGGDTTGPNGTGTTPRAIDPMEEMRRRYIPGRFVRLEGMIPADRAYAQSGSVSPWTSSRSADTPWIVLGATFERGAPPATATTGAPIVRPDPADPITRPLHVVAGTPADASVLAADATGGIDVVRYLVAFDGYPGYFVVPTTVPSELGLVSAGGSEGAQLRFTMGSAQRPDRTPLRPGEQMPATMRIAAVDSAGHVSAWLSRPLVVLPVGSGDLEVTLTMSEATDLDLYVTDPAGTTVYYGNTSGYSGGRLDLDANAACGSNMGINNEHIFWPEGQAPAGNYTVRVAHYESCIGGRPVDFQVTVRACGETVVLVGRFTGYGAPQQCLSTQGEPSWCQDVVSFQLPPCR